MLYDMSDDEEVTYETFKRYRYSKNSYANPYLSPTRNNDRQIIEISSNESQMENHVDPLSKIFESDHITEEMIETFQQYTLTNITEKEIIKLIVCLITRFQNCRAKSDSINLSNLMSCLNDIRFLLVVLSKKFIANEFIYVYREPLWKYLKSFLKYLAGLIKLETSASRVMADYEIQLVHMFNTLARLFQVKQICDNLRMEFMNHLLHLFFSSTTASINLALINVIRTAIYKYNWLDVYLYDIFKYETNDPMVRTKFTYKVDNEKYNIHSTTMLLIQIVDHAIDLNINDDLQMSLRAMFSKCYEITSLSLKYNQHVLVSLMKDLNKMSTDPTRVPSAGITILRYFILMHIRELIILDRIHTVENRELVDTYFETMNQICENFKTTESKCSHLDLTHDVIYELMDNLDDTKDQFTLMTLMFSTTILTKQSLNEADEAILKYSKLSFTEDPRYPILRISKYKRGKKINQKNQTNSTTRVRDGPNRVLNRGSKSNIALCFNYYVNERLKQFAISYCLQTVLTKIKNALSQASMSRYSKWLGNLQQFCSKNFPLLEKSIIHSITYLMCEIIRTCEHKVVQQTAVTILCYFSSKQESLYELIKLALCKLLRETDNVSAMKVLCEFFVTKFNEENEKLNLQVEPMGCPDIVEQKRLDIQFTVVHLLLVDCWKNPNTKPVILNFFSKMWFTLETLLSKLDHKIEQMIKLVQLNWRDELEQLIQEFLGGSVNDLKKSTFLSAKQIAYNVIINRKFDNNAWEIVLFISNVKSNILVEYFAELIAVVKETVDEQDFPCLQIVAKIVSNVIRDNKTSLTQKDLDDFKEYLTRIVNEQERVKIKDKVVCIELMRFCDIEPKIIQKNISKMYKVIEQSLKTAEVNSEEQYPVGQFYHDAFILSVWLNNWPEIIEQCEPLRGVHSRLVQEICKFYNHIQIHTDKRLAIQSLGKIHLAFCDILSSGEVMKLYGDVLKNSKEEYLKYLVVRNINEHIKETRKNLETTDANKKANLSLKSMENGILVETSNIANLYLSPLLDAYYGTIHPDTRGIIVKFVVANLKFGTLVAHQVVQHMIAMLTDTNYHIVHNVSYELNYWNRMDSTLLISNFKKGILNSYKLEKLLSSVTTKGSSEKKDLNNSEASVEKFQESQKPGEKRLLRGYKLENGKIVPSLGLLFDLIQKNSELFLKMLVKQLEESVKKLNNLGLFQYIVDNITTFPYTTAPQLRAILYELDDLLSDHGPIIINRLEQVDTDNDRHVYPVYLQMVLLSILIELKLSLWKKYAMPSDLIHNKRYETVKLKIKMNVSFNEFFVLKDLTKKIKLLYVKHDDSARVKFELGILRRTIAEEIETKDSENSEPDPKNLTYDEYIAWDAKKNFNNMENAKSQKIQQNAEQLNAPNIPVVQVEELPVIQIKETSQKDKTNPKKSRTVIKKEETKKKGTRKYTKKRSAVASSSNIDQSTSVIDNKTKTANTITVVADVEVEKKNPYKELYKMKRPIHPRTTEKAKQANIEWMIAQPEPNSSEETIRKSLKKVNFDNIDQMIDDQSMDISQKETRNNVTQSLKSCTNEKKPKNYTETKSPVARKRENTRRAEDDTNIDMDLIINTVNNNIKPRKNDGAKKKSKDKKIKAICQNNVEFDNIQNLDLQVIDANNNIMNKIKDFDANNNVMNKTKEIDSNNNIMNKIKEIDANNNIMNKIKEIDANNNIMNKTTEIDSNNNIMDEINQKKENNAEKTPTILDLNVNNIKSFQVVKHGKKLKKPTTKTNSSFREEILKVADAKNNLDETHSNYNKDDNIHHHLFEDEDEEDFINENKKRTKRQTTASNKKIKKTQMDKVEGKQKVNNEMKRKKKNKDKKNMTRMMENVMLSP